jgi:hypothetical protein
VYEWCGRNLISAINIIVNTKYAIIDTNVKSSTGTPQRRSGTECVVVSLYFSLLLSFLVPLHPQSPSHLPWPLYLVVPSLTNAICGLMFCIYLFAVLYVILSLCANAKTHLWSNNTVCTLRKNLNFESKQNKVFSLNLTQKFFYIMD